MGPKFVSTLQQYDIMLFLVGAFISVIAIPFAHVVTGCFCEMPLFGTLGAMTGAMTSAPSLNVLITVAGDDKVASSYATCQPVMTVGFAILPKLLVMTPGSRAHCTGAKTRTLKRCFARTGRHFFARIRFGRLHGVSENEDRK